MYQIRQEYQRTKKLHDTRSPDVKPTDLYQRIRAGQIFFPRDDPIFATLRDGIDANPSHCGLQDVIVWMPSRWETGLPERYRLLTLPCAHCRSWNTSSHGLPSSPFSRTVIGMFGDLQQVRSRHRCGDCGRTFLSDDVDCVAAMPEWAQLRFPVVATHRKMMTLELHQLITSLRITRMSNTGITGTVRGLREWGRQRAEHGFWAACYSIQDRHRLQVQATIENTQELGRDWDREWKPPEPYRPDDFPLAPVSSRWIRDVQLKSLVSKKEYMEASIQREGVGQVLAADTTFKHVARYHAANGIAPAAGVFNMMNMETGTVVAKARMNGLSHDDFAPIIEAKRQTVESLGLEKAEVIYTDNMADAAMFEPLLKRRADIVPPPAHLLSAMKVFAGTSRPVVADTLAKGQRMVVTAQTAHRTARLGEH